MIALSAESTFATSGEMIPEGIVSGRVAVTALLLVTGTNCGAEIVWPNVSVTGSSFIGVSTRVEPSAVPIARASFLGDSLDFAMTEDEARLSPAMGEVLGGSCDSAAVEVDSIDWL